MCGVGVECMAYCTHDGHRITLVSRFSPSNMCGFVSLTRVVSLSQLLILHARPSFQLPILILF